MKICPGEKVSPWTVLLLIEGAIEPCSGDTDELSMKAPMWVSKPVDLEEGVLICASKANGNRR